MYLVLPQVPKQTGIDIRLILPQLIQNCHILQYRYPYQYQISRLHPICQYNPCQNQNGTPIVKNFHVPLVLANIIEL